MQIPVPLEMQGNLVVGLCAREISVRVMLSQPFCVWFTHSEGVYYAGRTSLPARELRQASAYTLLCLWKSCVPSSASQTQLFHFLSSQELSIRVLCDLCGRIVSPIISRQFLVLHRVIFGCLSSPTSPCGISNLAQNTPSQHPSNITQRSPGQEHLLA